MIDPSFNTYKPNKNCFGYIFFEAREHRVVSPHTQLRIAEAFPVMIRKNFLVTFSVEPVTEKYDPANFALTLYAIEKYKFRDILLSSIRMEDGQFTTLTNPGLGEWLMGKKTYCKLSAQIIALLKNVTAKKNEAAEPEALLLAPH